MFEFKIYDLHYIQKFDDLGEMFRVTYDGVKWMTFDFALNINKVGIDSFRADVLIDDDGDITNCTKVYLSDGSFVFAKNNYDTFKKNYYAFLTERDKALNPPEQND